MIIVRKGTMVIKKEESQYGEECYDTKGKEGNNNVYWIIMRKMTEIINIVIIMTMMILLLMTITSGGAPRPRHCGENEISFTPNLVGSER